jgi:hypothetical protein
MDTQRSAEIQVVLEGLPLPATRRMLIEYARREDPAAAESLQRLPDGEYTRLDDVGAALADPPGSPRPEQRLPKPESGTPPGGKAYTGDDSTDAETGRVRDDAPAANPPTKTIEKQSKSQKRQQARQGS